MYYKYIYCKCFINDYIMYKNKGEFYTYIYRFQNRQKGFCARVNKALMQAEHLCSVCINL